MESKTLYRAKQFMPFASLKGYFDLLLEQERILEPQKELSESEAAILSDKIAQLQKGKIVSIKYYNKDAYENIEGIIANIDYTFRTLTVVKTTIKFEDILDISVKD